MGTGVKGTDKLVFVDDGTSNMVEIPFQGDATYNPNRQQSRQKNGVHNYTGSEGHTVSFSIEKERPALSAHTRLRTLSETGEEVSVEYRDKHSGGESLSGLAAVIVGEETAGVDGMLVQQVTITFVGEPVPAIVP